MKKAIVSRQINAPIQTVWDVLTTIQEYPNWNPFIVAIEANTEIPQEGCKMVFTVNFHDGATTSSSEYVTKFLPPQATLGDRAEWIYRFDGLLHQTYMIRAVRVQSLTALSDGQTLYESEEVFRGWGVMGVPLAKVQQGFEDQG